MANTKLNIINILLMMFSLVLAFLYPFHLFLFAYAVLGPLHYLTEISWLHRKDFFISQKNNVHLLTILGVLIFLSAIISPDLAILGPSFIALAFLLAYIMVAGKNDWQIFLGIMGSLLFIGVFMKTNWYFVFFAILLTTIVHVFIFTGCFMLYGALKEKSLSGYGALCLFLFFAGVSLFYHPEINNNLLTEDILINYSEPFQLVNKALADLLHMGEIKSSADLFRSDRGLSVMRFISFAYVYHYLNWFSKTSLIGWHHCSKKTLMGILIVWGVCISAYMINYHNGLIFLYLLSLLHILLEFPLNHRTIIGIGGELRKRLRST